MTRFVFIDTETTGLDPHKGGHRIIELACVEYEDKAPTGKVFNLKLNPEGKKSSREAFRVHGISDEELTDAPLFEDIHQQFVEFIRDAHAVIYNAAFDLKFLNAELNRINSPSTISDICSEVTCAMELAKAKFGIGRISQDSACRRYGIDISSRTIHSAQLDASLCAQLYFKLIDNSAVPLAATPQLREHAPTKAISISRAFKIKETGDLVQLNFCKNPECRNFGVPAKNPTYRPDGTLKRGLGNDYKLTRSRNKSEYLLTCKLCNQSSVMIHNRCFVNESLRLASRYNPVEPACPNTARLDHSRGIRRYYIPWSPEVRRGEERIKPRCKNAEKGIFSNPELYILAGKTQPTQTIERVVKRPLKKGGKPVAQIVTEEKLGSQRVKCKTCDTKFSVKLAPHTRHYKDVDNALLFRELMNKGIISRIEEKLDISAKVIYDKIDFFYQQALAFDHYYMDKLDHAVATRTLNLSSDRQHYLSNWGDHDMPMPTPIINTSTADNDTGFVFAATVNFDFSSDYIEIKKEHREKKEQEKHSYYRRFAQYVLSNSEVDEQPKTGNIDISLQMPPKGLLVHQTYSILGHFEVLKEMLKYSRRVNLYADNDAGFKMAIGAIFKDWIKANKLQAFQISPERSGGEMLIDKATSDNLKRKQAELRRNNPDLTEVEVQQLLWKEQLSTRVRKAGARSEWIVSPNPRSRIESVLPLFDLNSADNDIVSYALTNASLHGVDNWFQVLRRHVNSLERPVTSATNSKRWNAYAGYNPEWMTKLIEIKRIYFNYCMTNARTNKKKFAGKKKPLPTTPAMRFGLVDRVFTAEDILNFSYNKILLDDVYRK